MGAQQGGRGAGGEEAEGGQSELPIAPRRERKVSMVRAKTNLRLCDRFIGAGSACGRKSGIAERNLPAISRKL